LGFVLFFFGGFLWGFIGLYIMYAVFDPRGRCSVYYLGNDLMNGLAGSGLIDIYFVIYLFIVWRNRYIVEKG